MTEFEIRAARAEDVDGIAALDAWGWPERANPFGARSAPFSTRFSLADLTVALNGWRQIGFVALAPRTRLAANSHVGLVRSLLVAPDFRRAGVAKALLAAAEANASARGFQKIGVNVLSSNKAGLGLFARTGFVEEGRMRGEFRFGDRLVDDVHMGKWLPAQAARAPEWALAAGEAL